MRTIQFLLLTLALTGTAWRGVAQPVITLQPRSQTTGMGATVSFTVDASAFPAPNYQWQFNGVVIPGATNAVLQLENVARNQAGPYFVVASNDAGSVTSQVATLTVPFVVQFRSARSSVWETSRVASITVQRLGDGPEPVTVSYATSDGTATAGLDYTATSGTLTFGPGEAEKTFTIPILDDVLPEGAETLHVSLSGLTGPAAFGANTNAQVTIIDDDVPPLSSTRARPVLATGTSHTLALKADGSLWAWGDNYFGQLGIGADFGTSTNVPTRVGTDYDWATVAVGWHYTMAVKTDGSLWAWGDDSGPFGVGVAGVQRTNVPVRVGTDTDWWLASAGAGLSIGLKTDGSTWSLPSFITANHPVQFGTDFDQTWVAGELSVKQDSSLWNRTSQIGSDSDWEFVDIALTEGDQIHPITYRAGALKNDGSLWTWIPSRFRPAAPVRTGQDLDWATFAIGPVHIVAVKTDGSLWAWGKTDVGGACLGLGLGGEQLEPAQVGTDNHWVAVAAGPMYSIALKSDGSLWSWGCNAGGQLGLGLDFDQLSGTNVPTRIGTDNDWAQPSAPPVRGDFRINAQSLNPDQSRTLFFTHTNASAYYVLYRGESLTNINTPVDAALPRAYSSLIDRMPPATNATAFYRIRAVPRSEPLDLDQDGIDDYYELRHAAFLNALNSADAAQDFDGDGYSNLSEYRAGTDPLQATVRHTIAAGLNYTLALKQDGSLWAWGENDVGQLGDGTYTRREQPVRIGTNTDWISVSVGRGGNVPIGEGLWAFAGHTLALKRDGSLWAWGANHAGQLGIGSGVEFTNRPVQVGTAHDWAQVSAGSTYTLALKRDGSLWGWGGNSLNGYPSPVCCSADPFRIGISSDWQSIAAGGLHVLGLKTDGSLWSWGDNEFGQLGLGEGVVAVEPIQIGTANDWKTIAASGHSDPFDGAGSFAIKIDGSLWAWGYDDSGQLGLGILSHHQFTPSRVGTETNWDALAVSGFDTLARQHDGSLWGWGLDVADHPVPIGTNHDWTEFAVGGWPNGAVPGFAVALKSDGTLWRFLLESPQDFSTPTRLGLDTDWGAPR